MFQLTQAQSTKLKAWYADVKKQAAEKSKDPLGGDAPYYGAIGGGLTYSFTPTGLGLIVTVKEALTAQEIDLTDYEEW